MDENNPIVQILKQINDLSGAALDGLLKGGGGEGGQAAPEGSPAEEAAESPGEERKEKAAGQDRPFPPRQSAGIKRRR